MGSRRHLRPAHRPPAPARPRTRRTRARPSACLLGSQSVKTSANVHLTDQGYDAAKKIAGRKRHLVTDTLGLLLAVLVTSAAVHDSTAGAHLLDQISAHHPGVTKAWADTGYKNAVVEERTLGWLMHHRRLARDYETHPHRSAAMIHIAAIDLMSRRLTQETTPDWRGT